MPSYIGEPEFAHDARPCTGVLLANLGTPDAPDTRAVRRYLAEFLWDPRVVEAPRLLWWLVLHLVVLRLRPRRTAASYARIWTDEGSPLLAIGRRLRDALQTLLDDRHAEDSYRVALGMRYGKPSIGTALRELRGHGARTLVVLPLYPQYSATTTGSVYDVVLAELARYRWMPQMHLLTHYHDDEGYIAALAQSLRDAWRDEPRAERVLLSFHGLPQRYLHAGDPYHCQCRKTARLLAGRLSLQDGDYAVAFQSRVGREPWLAPYTDVLLREWAHAGVRTVDVVCPGFSADCLETLEEIAMRDRDLFIEAGGQRLRYIPALNARDSHVAALATLVEQRGRRELVPTREELTVRRARAIELGAAR